uniref:Uncharacterized protein n=4 Tax=Oryza TaxID=4527 RepID=Q10N01_ORYSJ|nr:hypothetical protein LOC_Os03g17890 [Oryza sativa Japonica Group]
MARGVVQLQQLVVVVGGVALNARMLLPRRLFSIRIFRYSDIPLVDHKRYLLITVVLRASEFRKGTKLPMTPTPTNKVLRMYT